MPALTTRGKAWSHVGNAPAQARIETLLIEEPLTISVGSTVVATTMRTPGHDADLAWGLLFSMGYIHGPDDVATISVCTNRAVGIGLIAPDPPRNPSTLQVTLGDHVPTPLARPRLALSSSACGVCSADLVEQATSAFPPPPAYAPLPHQTLLDVVARMTSEQRIHRRTGAAHGAALADSSGTVLVVREDVGRHNAVDKVVGWALAGRHLPLAPSILAVSSRVGFEIVDKAVRAGITHVVGVSAPTSLAVQVAEEHEMTLAGFARDDRITIYSQGKSGEN